MTYDFERGRWRSRPYALRWSQMVLGRRATQATLRRDRVVLVSAYRVTGDRLFYTDPVCGARAGPGVLYRIRVRLKPGVLC